MDIHFNNMSSELELINFINSGMGYTEIYNKTGILRDTIRQFSISHGIYDKLKANNQLYKSVRLHECGEARRLNRSIALDLEYGTKIEEMIANGGLLKDVTVEMHNVPIKQIIHFLKYKGLDVKRKDNSRKYVSIISKINGKKSAKYLTGKELKPITQEIIDRFLELKLSVRYKERVYVALKNEFGLGEKKCRQLCNRYGYPENNPQTGNLNPMFGKSPGKNAGIGVKCWVLADGNKFYCRSSLELKIMCYLIDSKIKFQLSKHRVSYFDNGVHRTYCPDIVIDTTIYEIKPSAMTLLKYNVLKHEALQKYCLKYCLICGGYITEHTYDLMKYDLEYMMSLIKNGLLIIDNKNLEKLKRNI